MHLHGVVSVQMFICTSVILSGKGLTDTCILYAPPTQEAGRSCLLGQGMGPSASSPKH